MVDNVGVMILDTGKATVNAAAEIVGYTKINSGNAIIIPGSELVLNAPKENTDQPSLAKDASGDGLLDENEVQTTSVVNRKYSIHGIIDFSTSAGQTLFANLLKMRRSVAVMAFRDDYFTVYDDNPVNPSYNNLSSQDSNFGVNKFVYGKITDFTFTRTMDTERGQSGEKHYGYITEFDLEVTYTQN